MTDLIPYEQIEDGFQREKHQVESLIASSILVFDQKHYSVSIGLSILAYEEVYKMQKFLFVLENKTGIKKEDWDAITKGTKEPRKNSHEVKYERSYLDRKKVLLDKGISEHLVTEDLMKKLYNNYQYRSFKEKTESNPIVLERLKSLNLIKNACFYLDWRFNDWDIFTKVAKEERKALAEFLLWLVQLSYYHAMLDKNHHAITNDENSEDFLAYTNDPLFKKSMELENKLKTKSFKKTVILAMKVLDNYRSRLKHVQKK